MRIEAFNQFGEPIKAEITRIVIFDNHSNPIALALEIQPDWIYTAHCRDKEFQDALGMFGLSQTVIVDTIDPKKMKPITAKR